MGMGFCKRWIGGIGVYGYIRVSHVFILSEGVIEGFPFFSPVLIHRVPSKLLMRSKRTTCVILRTRISVGLDGFKGVHLPPIFKVNQLIGISAGHEEM